MALAALAGCEHDVMKVPIATYSVAALPLLTAAQTRGLVSVPWVLPTSAPAGDPRFLEVPAGICSQPRGVVVTETPAAVTVQIFATITRCTAEADGFVIASVDLPHPLGTRTLRHGPVMPAGPVAGTAPPARQKPPTRSQSPRA